MKKRLLTSLWTLLLGVVPMFAYKDSADYGDGDNGMGFLYFLLAWIVISFIIVIGKKIFI